MYTTEDINNKAYNTSPTTQWFEYDSSLSRNVDNYVTLPLFFVAVIGNSLIFAVFWKDHYRSNLTAMLYRILAVADGLVVFIQVGLHTLPFVIFGKSVSTHNLITCKLAFFATSWFRTFSIWVIIALTIEKLICVCWPYRVKLLNTKRNYGWMVFALLTISSILYAPLLVTTGREDVNLNGKVMGICRISEHKSIDWYLTIFEWMNVIMSSLLPWCLVAIANTVIIRSFRKTLRGDHTKTSSSTDVCGRDRLRSNITILLLISTTSIVFTFPDPLYILLGRYTKDTGSKAFHRLITFGAFLPLFDAINRSINILLFCLFGRDFRQQLKELFLCRKNRNG